MSGVSKTLEGQTVLQRVGPRAPIPQGATSQLGGKCDQEPFSQAQACQLHTRSQHISVSVSAVAQTAVFRFVKRPTGAAHLQVHGTECGRNNCSQQESKKPAGVCPLHQSPPHSTRDPLKLQGGKGDGLPTVVTAARAKTTEESGEGRAQGSPAPLTPCFSSLMSPLCYLPLRLR